MDDLQGIARFGREFSEKHGPLDVLINNAGCLVNERKVTVEGLEYSFQVNTVGTYVLTTHIMKALAKSKGGRVITVSSGGMLLDKLDPNMKEKEPFVGDQEYSQHKRQQVVMMAQLSALHKDSGVRFFSMHPGWADTPGVRDSLPDFQKKNAHILRTSEQGADTAVWLALARDIPASFDGQFLQDRVPVAQHLPLVWTKSTPEEEVQFMKNLDALVAKFGLAPPAI